MSLVFLTKFSSYITNWTPNNTFKSPSYLPTVLKLIGYDIDIIGGNYCTLSLVLPFGSIDYFAYERITLM